MNINTTVHPKYSKPTTLGEFKARERLASLHKRGFDWNEKQAVSSAILKALEQVLAEIEYDEVLLDELGFEYTIGIDGNPVYGDEVVPHYEPPFDHEKSFAEFMAQEEAEAIADEHYYDTHPNVIRGYWDGYDYEIYADPDSTYFEWRYVINSGGKQDFGRKKGGVCTDPGCPCS